MSVPGLLGAAGLTAGLAAAGAAAGVALERALVRRSFGVVADDSEPIGSIRGESVAVTADDGVRLHAEIDEPDDPSLADLTIVFSHGYVLNLDCWYFQRRHLRSTARLVFWDQRSHGRSAKAPPESLTIDQLGRDLARIIEVCAPEGPVLLVGHSMGGMTIMSLAAERPELFGDRVVGVALIATSAGQLSELTLRMPRRASQYVHRRAERVALALTSNSERIERRRGYANDLTLLLTKRYSFGGRVTASQVEFVADLVMSTPIDVAAAWLPEFERHDKEKALEVLDRVDALVLVGDSDALTPASHSEFIASEIEGSTFVVLPRTGHMIITERPAEVAEQLRELAATVRGAPVAS